MAAANLVGGFRLGALLRPESDRATWLASDAKSGRAALVCLVPREVAAAAHARRELEHPGLTRILDVRNNVGAAPSPSGSDPRAHAFVVLAAPKSELLDAMVKRRGTLRRAEAVAIVAAVADGIVAVHESGGLHGGIAPGAIEPSTSAVGSARLGLRGGDPQLSYCSPERIADGSLSRRDDTWALACVLYFAVTGHAPFVGGDDRAVMQAVLHERPAVIPFDTRAGTSLGKILERSLLRVPSQRFADAAAFRDALRAWLSAHGGTEDEEAETTVALPPDLMAAAQAVKALRALRSVPPPAPGADSDATVPLPVLPLDPATGHALPPRSQRPGSSRPPPLPPALSFQDETETLSMDAIATLVSAERRGATPEELAIVRARLAAAERNEASAAPAPGSPRATSSIPAARPIPSLDAGPSSGPSRRSAPPRSVTTPPPARRSGALVPAIVMVALLAAGGVIAAARTGRVTIPGVTPVAPAKAPVVTPAVSVTAPRSDRAAASTPVTAPSASASVTTSASASSAPVAPTASASAAPPADVSACVARWFPSDAFATGADLGFVCAERSAIAGNKKLKRAIVVGGVGRGVTTAMLELSRYHWFELPVYATLRASCCPDPAVELPHAIQCTSPSGPILALAEATRSHQPIDEPLKAYYQSIACLVEHGEQSLYGESDIVHGGEEAAFRTFVARGK